MRIFNKDVHENTHVWLVTDEVQNLERQLEQGESRYRQLEESHNRSEQERSQQEVSQNQLLQRQQDIKEQLQQLQRELAAKDDLVSNSWGLLTMS